MRIFQPPVVGGGVHIYRVGYSRDRGALRHRVAWRAATYGVVLPTVRRGSVLVADVHVHRLELDQALLLFPGQAHAYGPLRPGRVWPHAALLCDGPVLRALHASGRISERHPILRLSDVAGLARLYRRLVRAAPDQLPPLVYQLFYMLGGGEPVLDRGGPQRHAIDDLIEAIATDPLADWDPHRLARDMGVGPAHFRRLFRAHSGDPPSRFLARARMRLAGRLLLEGASSVQAAARIGMHDPAHFSKRFSALMGASPQRWLRQQEAASG
ncbi:MAG: helix-turn-helix transcriptional regulator [Planctomycetota bacterium]